MRLFLGCLSALIVVVGVYAEDPDDLAAHWTGTLGDPASLTWGIVPDGTSITPQIPGESSAGSNLEFRLNQLYGSPPATTYLPLFQSYHDRWAELSGLSFTQVPISGGGGIPDASGAPNLRIGGHYIDGNSNILAYNFFPTTGDMVIDTADNFYNDLSDNSLRLRNTLAHELGHGLGMPHVESSDANFLLEPFINLSFDGPQHHDVLLVQRGYGDVNEAGAGNDIQANASALGAGLNRGDSLAIGSDGGSTAPLAGVVEVMPSETDFFSIDDASDIDFWDFTLNEATTVSLSLEPVGYAYQAGPQDGTQSLFDTRVRSDLTLELFDATQASLGSSTSGGLGDSESLSLALSPGTYSIRVGGSNNPDSATLDTQFYQLGVAAAALPASQIHDPDSSVGDPVHSHPGGIMVVSPATNPQYNPATNHLPFINHAIIRIGVQGPEPPSAGQLINYGSLTIQPNGGGANYVAIESPVGQTSELDNHGSVTLSPGPGSPPVIGVGLYPGSHGQITNRPGSSLTVNGNSRIQVGSPDSGSGAGIGEIFNAGTIAINDVGMLMINSDTGAVTSRLINQSGGVVSTASGAALRVGDLSPEGAILQNDAGGQINNDGTMIIGSNSQFTNSGSFVNNGSFSLAASATFTNNGNISGNGTFAGDFTGFTNNGTIAGTPDFSALSIVNAGTIAPGASPGIQQYGDLTLTGASLLDMELFGTTPGSVGPVVVGDFDQIFVTNNLTFDGTLNIILGGGFFPTAGQTFALFPDSGSTNYSANFATINLPVGVAATFDNGNGILTIDAATPVPEPATWAIFGALVMIGVGWRRRRI